MNTDLDPSKINRVLIYRLGSLGDTTIALPIFNLIRDKYPHATRALLTNFPVHGKAPAASAILGDSGVIHEYIRYPIGSRSPADITKTWMRVRRFKPDLLIYLAAPRGERAIKRDEFFFRACGITKIIGLPYGDLGKQHYYPDTEKWEREVERLARTVAILGDARIADLSSWNFNFTAAELAKADNVLSATVGRKLIACGVGTKMQAKDWETSNWLALLTRLAEKFSDYSLVMVGAKEEHEASEQASPAWNERKVNLCGELTPRETAAVLRKAELFLGPDSGPMHLAASAGVPCAIAFSARGRPGVWFPVGDHHEIVYHKTDCFACDLEVCVVNKKKCLLSITPDEMYDAAVAAWTNGVTGVQ